MLMSLFKCDQLLFLCSVQVKSVLDPCEDENEDYHDYVNLGADSPKRDVISESDSEVIL